MTPIDKDVSDAPIQNSVDSQGLQEKLAKDNYVSQFAKLGAKLLADTNKPNRITYAEFEPFIPLFNADKERYENDQNYEILMNRLYNRYIRELNINLYEPTVIVASETDPTELCVLPRRYTRIKSDNLEKKGARDTVPAAVSKVATTSRDDLILQASGLDCMHANKTAEQTSFFASVRIESSLIEKAFVERNLSASKREDLMKNNPSDNVTPIVLQETNDIYLDDDDD